MLARASRVRHAYQNGPSNCPCLLWIAMQWVGRFSVVWRHVRTTEMLKVHCTLFCSTPPLTNPPLSFSCVLR